MFGVDGYVPLVRAGVLRVELNAKAPTTWGGKCNLCGIKGHKAMECDRKSVIEGDTIHPMAYLFQKGLVNEWGLITEKGKKKKGL